MKRSTAICWTFILLAAFFCDGVTCKGGRGGARGAARGSARGKARPRIKSAPHYRSSGTTLRVAAAAAAGAAAGVAAGMTERRMRLSGEVGLDNSMEYQHGNRTDSGVYSYRSWTSAAQTCDSWPFAIFTFCLVTACLQLLPI